MTPRQRDELMSIASWDEYIVKQRLREAGREHAAVLLDAYEERMGIICEEREATPEDVAAAWSSTLGIELGRKEARECAENT